MAPKRSKKEKTQAAGKPSPAKVVQKNVPYAGAPSKSVLQRIAGKTQRIPGKKVIITDLCMTECKVINVCPADCLDCIVVCPPDCLDCIVVCPPDCLDCIVVCPPDCLDCIVVCPPDCLDCIVVCPPDCLDCIVVCPPDCLDCLVVCAPPDCSGDCVTECADCAVDCARDCLVECTVDCVSECITECLAGACIVEPEKIGKGDPNVVLRRKLGHLHNALRRASQRQIRQAHFNAAVQKKFGDIDSILKTIAQKIGIPAETPKKSKGKRL